MTNASNKTLALAAVSGILAALSGCGGSPPPAEVPGAPNEGAPAALGTAAGAHPAEKHDCGADKGGCNGKMMEQKKPGDPAQPAPGTPPPR